MKGWAGPTHCRRPPPGLETATPDGGAFPASRGHVLILRPHSQDCNRQTWRLRLRLSPQGRYRAQSSHSSLQGSRPMHQGLALVEASPPPGPPAPKCKPSQPDPSTQGLLGWRIRISEASCPTSPGGWWFRSPIPGPFQSWTWPLSPPASSLFQALLLASDATGSWVTWGLFPT